MNAATASPTWGILVALAVVGGVVLFSVAVVVFLILFARSMTKPRRERATFVPEVPRPPRLWPVRVGWVLFTFGAIVVAAFWISGEGFEPRSVQNRQDWLKATAVVVGFGLVLTWVTLTRSRPGSPPAGPGFWLVSVGWFLYVLAAVGSGVYLETVVGNLARPWEEAIGFFAVLGVILLFLTAVRYAWINRRRWAAAVSYAHPVAGQPEPVVARDAEQPMPSPPPRRPNLWLAGGALLAAAVVFVVWFAVTESKPIPVRAGVVGEAVDDEAKFMAAPLVFIAALVIGVVVGGVLVFRSAARKRTLSPTQGEQSTARGPSNTGAEAFGLLVSVVLGGTAVWAYLNGPGQPLTRVEFAGPGVLSVLVLVAVALSRLARQHKPSTPYDGYVRVRAQLGLSPNMTREEFNAKLEQELGQHARLDESARDAADGFGRDHGQYDVEQPASPAPVPQPRHVARTIPVLLAAVVLVVAGAIMVLVGKTRSPEKAEFLAHLDGGGVPLLGAVVVGCGVVALAWAGGWLMLRAVRRPKRKLTQQELDELIKSVPPLTREQRKAIFWSYLIVMALGVFFVLETVFSKMGPGASSIFVSVFVGMAALSMTLGIREWAFKKKPVEDGPPLAVAPLILTPDPTPAGGACPTCGNPIPAGSPQGLCPRCLIRGVMPSINATRARSVRPIDPPPPAEVNEFFPHLEVLELIGAGGMGAVYKARQPNLDRVVALKIVQSPSGDDDPVFAERFAREARAMARLDHPNIVTIYESGQAGGLPYMLMEFVDGITLRDAMENKVLTTSEALAVIPQICDALDYAHRTGVVHRDIKPENILIDQTGRVKIADFGLAKLAEAGGLTLTHTRQAMGTPHYMAPEQWEKPNEVDHRADIYALGVVLYELLTGELPLGRFDLPSAKGKGSAGLDQVVLRALAKEPGQRYQHASDLKGALSGLGNWWDGPTPRRGFYEFRSKRTFLGWPLVHAVSGRDPATGRLKVAKGWIAVSDGTAVGGIAVGGVTAAGGITVGGVFSVGLLAVGGAFSLGLLAIGGLAAALLLAVGGVAISPWLAVGGVAVGYFAIGGAAIGEYTLGGTGNTPEFWDVLRRHLPNLLRW